MGNPKFQIFTGNGGQFYFRLRLWNGQPILASEGYPSRDGRQDGITSVVENSPFDERYDRKTSDGEQFYFVLKAANGEPICKSAMYTSEQAMEGAVASVKENAPKARTADHTC
ncbi:MAG: YegP family protein [Flavobacteriales bacterium]|nr:YegP family protein [Flavobacteriales bacterium]